MIPGGQSVVYECWTLMAVTLTVFACRLISRRILLGSCKKFQFDDYLMTFNIACFIIVIFSIWLQVLWGNNYVTPEDVVGWTQADFAQAIEGAKWGIAMETCKITCVWGCKACLLFLYANLTKGLPKYERAVYMVATYVAVGYILVMVCLFTAWCKPFHAYYDVIPLPPSQTQCMTYRKHMIFDACFNITSDAMMLCLPIPLVIQSKVPRARKIALVGVFSLGTLVILCAILNRITNFTAPYGSLIYLNWYAGEVSTAVMVANVPHLWALVVTLIRCCTGKQCSSAISANQDHFCSQRSGAGMTSARRDKFDIDGYIPTGSEERIAHAGDKDGQYAQWGYGKKASPSESSVGDPELGETYMLSGVNGRGAADHTGHGHAGVAVGDGEQAGWKHDKGEKCQIVKTVHIDQYETDS